MGALYEARVKSNVSALPFPAALQYLPDTRVPIASGSTLLGVIAQAGSSEFGGSQVCAVDVASMRARQGSILLLWAPWQPLLTSRTTVFTAHQKAWEGPAYLLTVPCHLQLKTLASSLLGLVYSIQLRAGHLSWHDLHIRLVAPSDNATSWTAWSNQGGRDTPPRSLPVVLLSKVLSYLGPGDRDAGPAEPLPHLPDVQHLASACPPSCLPACLPTCLETRMPARTPHGGAALNRMVIGICPGLMRANHLYILILVLCRALRCCVRGYWP